MAGFDTTDIAAKTNPQPVNAFDTIGKLADIQNAQNQNRAFQAKQLAGQYLAQSTGPDGQIDFNKLSQFAAADPRIGTAFPDLLSGAKSLTQTGITTQQSQLGIANTQLTAARGLMAQAVTAAKINKTDPKTAAATALAQGTAVGLFPQDIATSLMGNGDFGDTAIGAILSSAGGTAPQDVIKQNQSILDLGGTNVGINSNQYTGEQNFSGGTAANTTNTLTPAAEAGLQPVVDPVTHETKYVPLSSVVTSTGQAKGPAPVAALAPGEGEAEATPKKGAGQQIADLQAANARAVPDETLTRQALAAADNYRSGPGSTASANLVTEIKRLTGLDVSPGAVAASDAQQVHTKIAQQLAVSANRAGMGLNATDVQTLIAQAASADNNISSEAIHQLGAMAIGGNERTRALNAAWEKTQKYYAAKGVTLTPKDFLDMQTQFNSTHDPRYFQEPFMTKVQKEQMYNAMSKDERVRYNSGKTLHNSQLAGYGQ